MTPRKIDPNAPKKPRGREPVGAEKMVQVALWMEPRQRDELRQLAQERGTTASAVIRSLIDQERKPRADGEGKG